MKELFEKIKQFFFGNETENTSFKDLGVSAKDIKEVETPKDYVVSPATKTQVKPVSKAKANTVKKVQAKPAAKAKVAGKQRAKKK